MEYIVKVIRDFNDYGGKKIEPNTKHIQRVKGDIFKCNKKRYLFLKENGVVYLVGINRQSK